MEKFTQLTSTAVPLPIEDIDTDQIIPSRYLKGISKEGFGDHLFKDWRYDNSGNPISDFVFNNALYTGKILIAGRNFGCGSSREHAAWALADYGFRVVISSFFADIFKGNAMNNGIVPITVSEEYLHQLFTCIEQDAKSVFTIDLEKQELSYREGNTYLFEIDAYKKDCLINGYDDIDFLLSMRKEIELFERKKAS